MPTTNTRTRPFAECTTPGGICTIEPYGSALLNDVKGSHMLSDGTDIYGKGYTDCVLACRAPLIEENPAALKAVVKGMMKAQLQAEQGQLLGQGGAGLGKVPGHP